VSPSSKHQQSRKPRRAPIAAKRPSARFFAFLKYSHPLLAEYATDAIRLANKRPADSLVNSRKFAEYLGLYLLRKEGIPLRIE